MSQKRNWIGMILGIGILLITAVVLILNTLSRAEPYSDTIPQSTGASPTPAATVKTPTNSNVNITMNEGMTANASAIGYGGPVLVRLTLDGQGKITAIDVGGARFAETEGVGSRVKDEAFTGQFIGLTPPLTLNEQVDAVAGATVSSRAVVDAVNEAAAFLTQKNAPSGTN